MAYDEKLAARIRAQLAGRRGVSERRMFGGLAFLLRGNMLCGVVGDDLMVRVGAEGYEAALARPHAREMDFTGRPMKGLLYVEPGGVATARQLRAWLDRGLAFVGSLPAK
jgi:TfoX/Sxy family transcriptional regulator of competence genes